MSKKGSKLAALFLSLAMVCSLVLPAWAFEDTDPPQWEEYGYSSLEELLTDWGLTEEEYYEWLAGPAAEQQEKCQAWLDAHPEEIAAFDPDAYFEEEYGWYYRTPEELMADWGLTREQFDQRMLNEWGQSQMYAWEAAQRRDDWLAAHPEEAAAFDPYAYFKEYTFDYYDSAQEYMDCWGMTPEEFEQEMLDFWVNGRMAAEEVQQQVDEYLARHPEKAGTFQAEEYFAKEYPWYDSPEEYRMEGGLTQAEFETEMLSNWLYDQLEAERWEEETAQFRAEYPEEVAAFDPYVWFDSIGYWWYDDAWDYMELLGLTEEEFYQEMFQRWMQTVLAMTAEKEARGGAAHGINVMVNGQCVPFPDVRPEARNGRTMVPLAAVMEHLGAQVSYDAASGAVQVTLGELGFTHVIGTDTLTLTDGSSIQMDAASYAKDGRTLVPVRFFGEVLGYDVLWDSDYQTAVLIDRQKLKDAIDGDFTLFNRVLWAASGAEELQEGQAVELTVDLDLDATLFDTLNGDTAITAQLTGTALYREDAGQITLSGDLSGLADLLDSFFFGIDEQTRQELSDLTVDIIYCADPGAVYFRSPVLVRLDLLPLEDPEAWAAIPAESFPLPVEALTGSASVGELAVAGLDSSAPFQAWDSAFRDAGLLLEYVSDGRFTQSGSSYTASFTTGDDEDWWSSEVYSGSIQLTPSGERGCTYAITLSGADSYMALDLDLSGSSGTSGLTMSFHIKNSFKYTLKLQSRVSAASREPLALPPEGSGLEFPYGPLGSGSM